MSTPYIGEIRMFAGNFAPVGWELCHGQLLSISENDTLFTLIGTTYGGDGQSTFALPDLRGRIPVHHGGGYVMGQAAGSETTTLTIAQIPAHSHQMLASSQSATETTPSNMVVPAVANALIYDNLPPFFTMNQSVISPVGSSQPHNNMMPYLSINFIISLFGIYPSQT
jgi:microcystin-dependent protein